jgi:hypothetical protein
VSGEIGPTTRPSTAVTPAEPTTPAKVTPSPHHDRVPVRGPAARGGRIRTGVGIGLQILLVGLEWWLEKKAAEAEQESIKKLSTDKLDPAVGNALIDQSATISQLTARDASHPLYANVIADFDSEWTESGIARHPDMEHVTDIRFVEMKFSKQNLSGEQEISKDDWTSPMSQVTNVSATKRVTFSFLVFHPEHEAERARILKSWPEFVEKNPENRLAQAISRLEPIPSEAASEFDKRRWLRNVSAIHEWSKAKMIRDARHQLGLR